MSIRWVPALALVLLIAACSDADSTASTPATEPPSATTAWTTLAPVTTDATTTSSTPTTSLTTTTTILTPPHLEVTDPVEDQVITTRTYTFHGVTDPGCKVAVGDTAADVDQLGEWTLDLILPPGSSATTLVATDPNTGLSSRYRQQLRYEPDVALGMGGVGDIECGTPYEEAIEGLQELLGAPSRIQGTPGADSVLMSGGPEVEWRWHEGGFSAKFADWSLCLGQDDGTYLHLIGWEIHGDSAGLGFGVTPGSTVAEFMAAVDDDYCAQARAEGEAYPDGCVGLSQEPYDGRYWFGEPKGLLYRYLWGYANGPDPATAVILSLVTEAPT